MKHGLHIRREKKYTEADVRQHERGRRIMEDVYEIAYKEMVYNMIFDTINERYAEAQQESDEDAGDPIKYASINTSYWQEHFYAFGRLN